MPHRLEVGLQIVVQRIGAWSHGTLFLFTPLRIPRAWICPDRISFSQQRLRADGMDGLAMALHCFYNTSSFSEAVTRCVNFLGDADSTAAICGQIAGSFYGFSGIDTRFVERLERWDNKEVACKAVLLWALGAETDVFEEPDGPSAVLDDSLIERTPKIARLMEMGFSATEADGALKRAGDDLEQAAQVLLLG